MPWFFVISVYGGGKSTLNIIEVITIIQTTSNKRANKCSRTPSSETGGGGRLRLRVKAVLLMPIPIARSERCRK